MNIRHAASRVSFEKSWHELVDAFLSELLAISKCDYAALGDKIDGRERYRFSSRSEPLPDIDWNALVNLFWRTQQSHPEYSVIDIDQVTGSFKFGRLAEHFDSGLFTVTVSLPLIADDNLIGIVCLFGGSESEPVADLKGNLRKRLENIALMTAYGLSAINFRSSGSGFGDNPLHQEAIRGLPEGVLMADNFGRVVDANEAFAVITGIPVDSLIGRDLKERPLLATDCDYLVARLLSNNQPFEVTARIGTEVDESENPSPGNEQESDGRFIRLKGTPYPSGSEIPDGLILLATDITREVMLKREANRIEQRHTQEINLATRLQQDFFPSTFRKKRIRMATRLIAANELAGDFFDIFDLGPNTIGVVIGDVVGKGIPGSLMAMSVHGMIANQAGALIPPMKVLERVNNALYHQSKGDYWYATCFYAKIHVTQLSVTFARAGHELPLWYHSNTGEVTFLEGEGLPLGIFPDSQYVTQQIVLEEGDKLFLYTDGLTDAVNIAGKRFGHDRLVELFSRNCSLSAKNLLKLIENEIISFTGERGRLDDIAMALLSVVPDSWTTLTIPPYSFQEILDNLMNELSIRGVDEDTSFKIRLSLDECVTNAFRHGNRNDDRKSITVSYLIEPDKLIMKIRDSGQGFDFGLIPDPTLDENLMSTGGRGVFITIKMMDEVSFNDVGNEITLIKFLHSGSS